MDKFTTKYSPIIAGVLSGFDRLFFRGSIRRLCFADGMMSYLYFRKLLLKDFGAHALEMSQRIRTTCEAAMVTAGRPVQYLPSCQTSKEEVARRSMKEQGITEGAICLLSCVEPCFGFDVRGNKETKRIEMVSRLRKCIHLYRYEVHPVFGFMHSRIQTWFPFNIQVCINGREWLARQIDQDGLGYIRHDNCFVHLADYQRAQELMDTQLRANWAELLDEIAHSINPLHTELFGPFCQGYYWSARESEWATDVVFNDPQALRRLYPLFIRHGMSALSSPDVMRFLGRKVVASGSSNTGSAGDGARVNAAFTGEVTSDMKRRQEGVRIKHRVNQNSVKAYDKAYTDETAVLRIETTMNSEKGFKVYRAKEGDANGPLQWRALRRGTADMYRRAQVCQASNERYINALASVNDSATLEELLQQVTKPVTWHGNKVRGLRPFETDDMKLIAAISRGEFTINGLRNRDLQYLLYGAADKLSKLTPQEVRQEVRRRSGRITRKLRMLRAHGLLVKVAHTQRYQLTDLGRQITTAILTVRNTPINRLAALAA